MSKITDLVASLKSMELPKGAESLLSAISSEATALEADRDSALEKVTTRQNENTALKQRAQTAESERDELKGKLPDGARILPKDEAKLYDAFTALNLKPDEIKARLEEATTDRQALVAAGNKEALATLGLKPSALRLREFDGATIQATKDKDGKVTATVKAGETETPWEQFVKEKGLEGDLGDFKAQPSGVVVLPQVTGNGASSVTPTAKIVDELNAARESRPNPLLKGNTNGTENKVLP